MVNFPGIFNVSNLWDDLIVARKAKEESVLRENELQSVEIARSNEMRERKFLLERQLLRDERQSQLLAYRAKQVNLIVYILKYF